MSGREVEEKDREREKERGIERGGRQREIARKTHIKFVVHEKLIVS